MCLIIHKPKNKRIPREYLANAMRINPHGFGMTNITKDEVVRTLNYKNVERLVDTDDELVCHFRYATVGKVNESNIHPFDITNAPRYHIYSNGTIDGYGNVSCSDIRMVADKVLGSMNRKKWVPFLKQTDTRFCIVDTLAKKVQRINKWYAVKGVWYSKANCFQTHRVAVYGTLKFGYGNHPLLEGSQYVGEGKTTVAYPLEVSGLPYLHDAPNEGHKVEVEVYDVTHDTLLKLDRLEGHPTFYKRKQISISMEDWSETSCWVYFVQKRKQPSHYDCMPYYTRCESYDYLDDWSETRDYEMSNQEFILK